MTDNNNIQAVNNAESSLDESKNTLDACPHCGAATGSFSVAEIAAQAAASAAAAATAAAASAALTQSGSSPKVADDPRLAALASSSGTVPTKSEADTTLTKWEQDTYRDILSNVNNTLRFQIQLAVPILAGCVTALNMVPPQEHQEFLNNYDRWVFCPVLLSMAVSYYGLELHWGMQKGRPTDDHESLTRLVRKKYALVHSAILLQALGLLLLFIFVLLEYK